MRDVRYYVGQIKLAGTDPDVLYNRKMELRRAYAVLKPCGLVMAIIGLPTLFLLVGIVFLPMGLYLYFHSAKQIKLIDEAAIECAKKLGIEPF